MDHLHWDKRFLFGDGETGVMNDHRPSSIAGLCDSLLQAYEIKGLQLTATLQPPLSEDVIRQKAAAAGVEIADELVELYLWRNGASGAQPTFQLAGKAFLPLEAALVQRQSALAAMHPKDQARPDVANLVPFAFGDEQWYALATPTGDFRPVLLVVEEAQPYFESLQAMLATCIAWVNEPDWTPELQPAAAMEIWYTHNPSIDE